jgi:hypothetical protein
VLQDFKNMEKSLLSKERLEKMVLEKLEELFSETKMVEKISAQREIRDGDGPDLVMEVSSSFGTIVLLVDVSPSGEPRFARQSVNHLLVQQKNWSHGRPIFAAPFISEKAAQICEKHNVGYVDLGGNCRLAAQGLYIHTMGRPNLYTNKRRLKSLIRPKASRILRVLLTHPKRRWKARDLAAEAGVSLGLVSNVKQILKDREWIDTKSQRIILSRADEILQHWAGFSDSGEKILYFHCPVDFIEAENRLDWFCRKKGIKCAFTGLSAAVHLASGIDYYRQIQARIYGDQQLTAQELGFEKTGAKDANLAVIISADKGVFYGMRQVQAASRLQYCRPSEKTVADIEKDIQSPIAIVSAVQAYMDLTTVFDSGVKEAKKIFDQVIEPSW